MKIFRSVCALFSILCTTVLLRADCPGLEATLEFFSADDDPATPCYEVHKGGQITLEACVKNCSGAPQYVRVNLFASTTEFNACSQTGTARLVATDYIIVADGVTKCVTRTITISANAPSATLYYQLKAQTASKRGPKYVDCSDLECVTILL